MFRSAASLTDRLTAALLILFGLPTDADSSAIAAAVVLSIGALVDVVLRRCDRDAAVTAVHRASELPAQDRAPDDPKLLALLSKLGVKAHELDAAWRRCNDSDEA